LGDATEEFIESLDKKEGEASDDEMTYALASVLGECGGLKVRIFLVNVVYLIKISVGLCYGIALILIG
jgi:E3 ubiquitin-protein ligase UBR4